MVSYSERDLYIDIDEYKESKKFPTLKKLSARCVNDNKIDWWNDIILPLDDIIEILVDNMWSPFESCYIVPSPYIWHRIGKFTKRHPKHKIYIWKFDINILL